MKIRVILLVTLLLGLFSVSVLPAAASATRNPIPTFAIIQIVPDVSITVRTYNFPAGKTFNVLMGPMGSRGMNGVPAGTIATGGGGSFTSVIVIPSSLHGQYQIAVRMQAADDSGYYAYNWFYNQEGGSGSWNPAPPPAPLPTAKPMPVFWITNVYPNVSVNITTQNFPANKVFNAYMNVMGTRGINGVYVGSVSTGAGGSLNYSFNIPINLRGLQKIAIRLEVSDTSGWFAYNWFYNTGR